MPESPSQGRPRRRGGLRSASLALLALLALLMPPGVVGCGLDVGAPVGAGGGDDEVPEVVVRAFAESCVTGCHSASNALGGLNLERGALPALLTSDSRLEPDLPLVRIGDLAGSMIARKVMEPETLALYGVERRGSQMPLGSRTDRDLENVAVILAWIAGARFPEGDGGDIDGDDGDTGDTGGFGLEPW